MGFKDFEWMRKDPNLESIRDDPRYNASQSRSQQERKILED